MAVALDAYATAFGGNGTSVTFSFTCSGSDRLLLCGVGAYEGSASSLTYNGVAATKLIGTGYQSSVWGLVNPNTGANNIVVSWSEYRGILYSAASWTGVNQTTPVETANITTNTDNNNTSTTNTTTCPTDGAIFGSVCANYQSGAGVYTIISGTLLGANHTSSHKAGGYRTSTGVISWDRHLGYASNAVQSYGIPINPVAAAASLRPQALTILDAVHRASNW